MSTQTILSFAFLAAWSVPQEPSLLTVDNSSPKYLSATQPDFRSCAEKKGTHGTLTVSVVVDDEGHVKEAKMIESSGIPCVDFLILPMMRTAKFRAAELEGKPVTATSLFDVSVSFFPHKEQVTVVPHSLPNDMTPPVAIVAPQVRIPHSFLRPPKPGQHVVPVHLVVAIDGRPEDVSVL